MRMREQFNDGWRCHVGELPSPPGRGSSKAGGCGGYSDLLADELPRGVTPDGEDSLLEAMIPGFEELSDRSRPATLPDEWDHVTLPHDWRIEQARSPSGPIWQAFAPAGVAYYRRTFSRPDPSTPQRLLLEFEGVMRDATVWLNGFLVGTHLSGYTGFQYDITELTRYGNEGLNVLLVRTDTATSEGWWYEGGGIYRNVWLTAVPEVHVDAQASWVITRDLEPERALLEGTVRIRNRSGRDAPVRLTARVVDQDGTTAASTETDVHVAAGSHSDTQLCFEVATPRLWDVHDGQLYDLHLTLEPESGSADQLSIPFGIRTVQFQEGAGLLLNGNPVALRGANIHQDFGGVGVAVPDALAEHKLHLLADMGCNVIRTAHHPPAPGLLQAADRLGLMVVAENRLLSTAPAYLDDLESLVTLGRNHPSVIMWSLENEEYLQATPQGERILKSLVAIVRRLDPTRPTMVGAPRSFESTYFDAVDVLGAHYQSLNQLIGDVQSLRPSKPLLASEEGLFPSTRGQYEDDRDRGRPSAFGTTMGLFGAFPRIMAHLTGQEPIAYDLGATWSWFDDHPEVAGALVWAGIDYFGEPTPMQWPVHVSNYGAMDVCGFPKDYYWLLRSYFRPEPIVHTLPHWTWLGFEGKPVRLWVYSNCDEVEILVNGASVDRRTVHSHIARWDDGIPYQPGTLVTRGYTDGVLTAEQVTRTAGPPAGLRCTAAVRGPGPAGDSIAVVTIDVVDRSGLLCPWADNDLLFEVAGDADILGVANGDPASLEPHTGRQRRAFRGKAMAIVRIPGPAPRTVDFRATAEDLREGSVTLSNASGGANEPTPEAAPFTAPRHA